MIEWNSETRVSGSNLLRLDDCFRSRLVHACLLVLSLLVVAMRQNYEKCANGSERLGGGKNFVNFFTNFPETAAIELV